MFHDKLSQLLDEVPSNTLAVYKRDYFAHKHLWNFFYSLEKILKWSPMAAYHRREEVDYITHQDAIAIWNNYSLLNVNKVYRKTIDDRADKLYTLRIDKLYSINQGIFFGDIFLAILFFFFVDIYLYEFWFDDFWYIFFRRHL